MAAITARIQEVQMKKERQEKENMMRKKCNRPDCDNNGLHRCKRCKTVSVELRSGILINVTLHEAFLFMRQPGFMNRRT